MSICNNRASLEDLFKQSREDVENKYNLGQCFQFTWSLFFKYYKEARDETWYIDDMVDEPGEFKRIILEKFAKNID